MKHRVHGGAENAEEKIRRHFEYNSTIMDKSHPKYNEDFLKLRVNPAAGDGGTEYFTCGDGARLFVQYWLPESEPERVVVCLHGMSGHGWYYSMVADALTPAGAAVYVPDQRSHGLSDGPKGDMPNVWKLVEDAREFVRSVRARHPAARVFVLGESMGGGVTANLMMEARDLAEGMILIAPAIKAAMKFTILDMLPLPLYFLFYVIRPSARVVKVAGNEPRGMKNEHNIRYDQNDPLHQKYVTPRFLLGVKFLMDRAAKEGAGKITLPALVIQGGKDTGISPEGTRDFFEKLASTDKTFKFYPEGYHCMMTDPDCGDIFSVIRNWVMAR